LGHGLARFELRLAFGNGKVGTLTHAYSPKMTGIRHEFLSREGHFDLGAFRGAAACKCKEEEGQETKSCREVASRMHEMLILFVTVKKSGIMPISPRVGPDVGNFESESCRNQAKYGGATAIFESRELERPHISLASEALGSTRA
jgi:hypothetical protein